MKAIDCPVPASDSELVMLAHGGGGTRMHALLASLVVPGLGDPSLAEGGDAALLELEGARLAFTTDSYVVKPLFFPGGDIGTLAVSGTVNDLAMVGARPLFLSCALIAEEGLPMEVLARVLASMRRTAEVAGVRIVTGDTKVVDRGKGDALFVNTAGIGVRTHDRVILPRSVREGDVILLSGDLGRHGIAVMAAREDLGFDLPIESDVACLHRATEALLAHPVHCFRDLTRGGLASALVEIGTVAGLAMAIDEARIPVSEPVSAACEILGLEPIHVANEGRFVAFVPEADAEAALATLRGVPGQEHAVAIGRVTSGPAGRVTLRSRIGTERLVVLPSGEQLPRIC